MAQRAPNTLRAGATCMLGFFGVLIGCSWSGQAACSVVAAAASYWIEVMFPVPAPFSVGIACGGFTMGLVSTAFVVVVVLGDSVGTGSWACSLKSVSLLP